MKHLIDPGRITIVRGTYATAPAGALLDRRLLMQVQGYRRQLSRQMVPMDRERAWIKIPPAHYHISIKVDGEFTVLAYGDGQAITINAGGTVRMGLPVIEEARARLAAQGLSQALVVGELFVKRIDGKRCRVHDVIHATRNPQSEEELDRLHYAVFDILELDRQPRDQPYQDRWDLIRTYFEEGERVVPVQATWGDTSVLRERYTHWVEVDGEEGIVARSDAGGLFKIKPRHSVDAVVIGFTEGIDNRAGLLHDLLLAVLRADEMFHVLGRVGGGFTEDQRRTMLSDLMDMAVESEFIEANSDGVAYQMVRPQWVIELSCLDLVAETTRGGTIDRMVLDWDDGAQRWRPKRRLPVVSVISPQFVRIRDDKRPVADEAGIGQLSKIVDIPMVDVRGEELELPKSTLLRREVRVKEARGSLMVRKFLLWKTNKEAASPEFPAFALYKTDLSWNRKEVLKREIWVSSSREQLEDILEQEAASSFVTGWQEPPPPPMS